MSTELRVPQVELAAVNKTYGSNPPVLQQIDLTIAKGEFVSLIGPSGCGKSTLLKLISGLTNATSGTILVDGMTPVNARETISYIFQDATLLPWRTVTSNVGLGLELEHVGPRSPQTKSGHAAGAGRSNPRGARLSAAALGRNEDARLRRPSPCHQAAPAADG